MEKLLQVIRTDMVFAGKKLEKFWESEIIVEFCQSRNV